eukprot:3852804-Rhodomonas_salina.2
MSASSRVEWKLGDTAYRFAFPSDFATWRERSQQHHGVANFQKKFTVLLRAVSNRDVRNGSLDTGRNTLSQMH